MFRKNNENFEINIDDIKSKSPEDIKFIIDNLYDEIENLYQEKYSKENSREILSRREDVETLKEVLDLKNCPYEVLENFNKNIPYIEKIEFVEGGTFGGLETRIVDVFDDYIIMTLNNSYNNLDGNKAVEKKDFPYNKDEFLYKLENLNLGSWDRQYQNEEVVDGTNWEVLIKFNNDIRPVSFKGSNMFPYNYENFRNLLAMDYDFND